MSKQDFKAIALATGCKENLQNNGSMALDHFIYDVAKKLVCYLNDEIHNVFINSANNCNRDGSYIDRRNAYHVKYC